MGVGDSARWLARHFSAVTLFGTTWSSLALVPGVLLVLLPMGAAGATRLVVAADGVPGKARRAIAA